MASNYRQHFEVVGLTSGKLRVESVCHASARQKTPRYGTREWELVAVGSSITRSSWQDHWINLEEIMSGRYDKSRRKQQKEHHFRTHLRLKRRNQERAGVGRRWAVSRQKLK